MAEPRGLEGAAWQHTCPQCGYENGFHVSFRRATSGKPRDDVAVWLICPSCSTSFDVGMRVRLSELPKA